MQTYLLSPVLSATLSATHIAVREGYIILTTEDQPGALGVGMFDDAGNIEHLGKPTPKWIAALSAALVEYALDHTDWDEIHALWALAQGHVWLWPNGRVVHLEAGLVPDRDWGGVCSVACAGPGQIDSGLYAEGWAEHDSETGLYHTADGRALDFSAMVRESIREGQWIDWQDAIAEAFRASAASLS